MTQIFFIIYILEYPSIIIKQITFHPSLICTVLIIDIFQDPGVQKTVSLPTPLSGVGVKWRVYKMYTNHLCFKMFLGPRDVGVTANKKSNKKCEDKFNNYILRAVGTTKWRSPTMDK